MASREVIGLCIEALYLTALDDPSPIWHPLCHGSGGRRSLDEGFAKSSAQMHVPHAVIMPRDDNCEGKRRVSQTE